MSDVRLFTSTEDAIAYGKALRAQTAPDDFQTLVRSWLVASFAADNAPNAQAKVMLATRSQSLREAVKAFLWPETNGDIFKSVRTPDLNEATATEEVACPS
jgi:hypothetical protein